VSEPLEIMTDTLMAKVPAAPVRDRPRAVSSMDRRVARDRQEMAPVHA
jgi:hypothetical protein